MREIAYRSQSNPDGTITIEESTGQTITSHNLDELLDWLLFDYQDKPDHICVTWDLAQFVAPILRKLGIECCQELVETHRTKLYKPYKIFYRYRTESGGVFGIDKGFKRCTFNVYSLNQFFPEGTPPPETVDDTRHLAWKLLQSMGSAEIYPDRLTSPIAAFLSCQELPVKMDGNLPVTATLAEEYAFNCTSKEWRDCFKVGHWDKAYDYDITNAYAYAASELLDSRNGGYIYSDSWVPGSSWGFMKGKVTINDGVKVSPIMCEMPDGSWGTPTGTWETYLTLDEAIFIKEWAIGRFIMDDGWFVKFNYKSYPLKEFMQNMYRHRLVADTRTLGEFLKDVANGLVGKLLQINDDGTVGEYYNPMWHALITSRTRLRVAKFIYENKVQDNTIAVNTDGCLLDTMIPMKALDLGRMGGWRCSGVNPAIALSPGLIFTADKKPQGINYDTLSRMMRQYPGRSEYRHQRERHTTLLEAVKAGELSQVGAMNRYAGAVNLPSLAEWQTREFEGYPATGGQLMARIYNSKPFALKENK